METHLPHVVAGSLIALEDAVDVIPVRAFDVRITDEIRDPHDDLTLVVIKGGAA